MPRVSVIMPSYNKSKYIAQSIESVLNQTYEDFELIIIDDASTDNSIDIIRSYDDPRIRLLQNACNCGMVFSRNRGLEESEGTYIALLDADDISIKNRLEKEVFFLDNNKDIDVVFGSCQEIDENNNIKELYFNPLKNPYFIKAELMVNDVVPNGSCMYRKEFIDMHNIRYRDGYWGMDDYLFWVECSLHGKITGMSEIFLYWRNTQENSTNTYMNKVEYKEKRKQKYAEIQRIALEKNGFILNELDLALYNKFFSEENYKIIEQKDFSVLLKLIKDICFQARGKDNFKEIKQMYKKKFAFLVKNSYIWDEI